MKKKVQTKAKVEKKQEISIVENLENFLFKYNFYINIGVAFLAFLMSLLMFQADVSIGGDDSVYIKNAFDLVTYQKFPTWQGPFYPMFLALFYKIFGLNIILFKIFSCVFFAFAIFFFYKLIFEFTFESKCPKSSLVAFFSSIICSISFVLLNYSSSTYTEPIFMLMQFVFLFYLLKYLQKDFSYLYLALLSLLTYTMFQTRSIAIVLPFFAILVLLMGKKYKDSIVFFVFTFVFHLISTLFRKLVYDAPSNSFDSQLDNITLVDPYKIYLGKEEFWGYFVRIYDNCLRYFSCHLMRILGFREYDSIAFYGLSALILTVIILFSLIYLFKKNKKFFYVQLYAVGLSLITFVMLQKVWSQERLIMIFYPIFLASFFVVLRFILQKTNFKGLFILVFVVIFGSTFFQFVDKYDSNKFGNFRVGEYCNYQEDWQNYMKASLWASENLPESSRVMCRKPQMSWITSGKEIFVGINRVYAKDSDSIASFVKDSLKVDYVIMANLRINPQKKDGNTINTVRNTLKFLLFKYPYCLKKISQFGNSEPAFLYKLDFSSNVDSLNIDNAIEVDSQSDYFWVLKAYSFSQKNQYDKAIEILNSALKKVELKDQVYYFLGCDYYGLQQTDTAIDFFKKAINENSQYDLAMYKLAMTYFSIRDFKNADFWIKKAISLNPDNDYLYYSKIIEKYSSR